MHCNKVYVNCKKGLKLKKNLLYNIQAYPPPPFITHYNKIQNYPLPPKRYIICARPQKSIETINIFLAHLLTDLTKLGIGTLEVS